MFGVRGSLTVNKDQIKNKKKILSIFVNGSNRGSEDQSCLDVKIGT